MNTHSVNQQAGEVQCTAEQKIARSQRIAMPLYYCLKYGLREKDMVPTQVAERERYSNDTPEQLAAFKARLCADLGVRA